MNSSSVDQSNARDAKSKLQPELQDLLARVEAATGPDREADGRIWCWLEGHSFVAMSDGHKCWADYGENDAVSPRSVPSAGYMIFRNKAPDRGNAMLQGFHAPRYTASLDAALALVERVLPGRGVDLLLTPELSAATIRPKRFSDDEPDSTRAKTPALAVLAALLTALSAQSAGPAAGSVSHREEPK